MKKVRIVRIIIVATIIILISILLKIGIEQLIIYNQMKKAINAITIKSDVIIYKGAKEKNKLDNLEIGTNVYILKNITDKNGKNWYKVKTGKKVGYILSDNVNSYKKSEEKKVLMIDVSKFNMQNNFTTIGEFKACLLNNNINYVYIRAGGRGYGNAGNLYTDPNYKEYAEACEYLNIPFGFYFLDEAITSEEVDEEYKFITEFISNNKYEFNKLPIALDVEKHIEKGRADEIWDDRYVLVNELIEKLKNSQNNVIVYSNAKIANQYLYNVKTALWLAYYPNNIETIPNYWYPDTSEDGAKNKTLIYKLVAWQFSEKGIKNIINEKIDISIVYNEFFDNGSMEQINNDLSKINYIYRLKEKNKNVINF